MYVFLCVGNKSINELRIARRARDRRIEQTNKCKGNDPSTAVFVAVVVDVVISLIKYGKKKECYA